MKKIFALLLFVGSICLAQNQELAAHFENYAKQTMKEIDGDVMKDLDIYANLNLNPNTDLAMVKNVIVTLINLDREDPSRTAVMILGPSYRKHTALYKEAFSALRNPKNKTQLEEIESLMKNFSRLGNG